MPALDTGFAMVKICPYRSKPIQHAPIHIERNVPNVKRPLAPVDVSIEAMTQNFIEILVVHHDQFEKLCISNELAQCCPRLLVPREFLLSKVNGKIRVMMVVGRCLLVQFLSVNPT